MSTHIQKKTRVVKNLSRTLRASCAVALLLKIINSQSLFIRPAYKMVREKSEK